MENSKEIKKRFGIIVAIEIGAVYKIFANIKELPCPKGYKLFLSEQKEYDVYILRCGMGEINSSSGTQYLISACNVSCIINFGVVGGLTPDMKKEKICLVRRIVHYKYDCSEFMDLRRGQVDGHDSIFLKPDEKLFSVCRQLFDLKEATCCSGDKFVASKEEKELLHEEFEGDICDMESAGIVLACESNDIPCLLLKAVSDGLSDGADGFYNELENASLKCLQAAVKIMDGIALID